MVKRMKDPLEYLLAVMRDETATPYRRDRAAAAALPYCHPKKAEVGVKAEREAAAKHAGRNTEWGDDLEAIGTGRRQ